MSQEKIETITINNVEYVRKDSLKAIPETFKDIVMVRTYSAGVHFGKLTFRNGKEVELQNAYRVFYWSNACSLSQLAIEGSGAKNKENKIAMAVPSIILTEAIEIIPMTKLAYKNLTEVIWKK